MYFLAGAWYDILYVVSRMAILMNVSTTLFVYCSLVHFMLSVNVFLPRIRVLRRSVTD